MKKIITAVLVICLSCMALAACGNNDTTEYDSAVVGTWTESYFDSGYIFNDDLTGTDTFWDLTFTYTALDGVMVITYDDEIWGEAEYTYTVSGNTLTMTRISDDEETSAYTYTKVADEDESSQDGSSETGLSETSSETSAETSSETAAAQ